MHRHTGVRDVDRADDFEQGVDELGRERDRPLEVGVAGFDLVHPASVTDAVGEVGPPAGVGDLPREFVE